MPIEVASDFAHAAARRVIYRFLSMSLLEPRTDGWRELTCLSEGTLLGDAAELIRAAASDAAMELAPGERALDRLEPSIALARLPLSFDSLQREFDNAFGLLSATNCPPCETEFIRQNQTFQRSNALADIAGYYRAFGCKTTRDRRERPDHIGVQLEFMAVLIGLETLVAAERSPQADDRRIICREAQANFLRDHLCWWAPAFARLLERQCPDGYLAAVGGLLAAFLPTERAFLKIAAPHPAPAPSLPLAVEDCGGCEMVSP